MTIGRTVCRAIGDSLALALDWLLVRANVKVDEQKEVAGQ